MSLHGASCLRTFTSLNLTFDFGRNTSTLSEFIGYPNLTDFHKISPEHSRDKGKRKWAGQFGYLTFFFAVTPIYKTRLAYFLLLQFYVWISRNQ